MNIIIPSNEKIDFVIVNFADDFDIKNISLAERETFLILKSWLVNNGEEPTVENVLKYMKEKKDIWPIQWIDYQSSFIDKNDIDSVDVFNDKSVAFIKHLEERKDDLYHVIDGNDLIRVKEDEDTFGV